MAQDRDQSAKKINVWLPLLFALVLVTGMLIGMNMQETAPTVVVKPEEQLMAGLGQGKIEELIRYIEAKYVDEVNRDELVKEAIESILKELDPHSKYIPAEQLRQINEQLEGNFEGIGVEFMILNDTIVVVSALPGGPSEAAGIRAGDKIVEVEDSSIAGIAIESREVMDLLRGEKGSEVEIGVLRPHETKVLHYTITRDKIPMHSVDAAYMLDDKTGYIKINRFSATTYEEFMKAMEDMVDKEGMEDLVIDLRHNPGGYLQQATNILSQIIEEKDKLLVYTEGRSVHRSNYESTGRTYFDIDDVVVLIDEGSASASEIVAGAVQDHDRGFIIGRRSFGKGLVQEQYRLRDGSALRLTVARYYTPSGRSIQKPYQDLEAYENDMTHRYESGELIAEEDMAIADSTEYFTSKGRVVYGGGGIMPDIFVPMDTAYLSDFYAAARPHIPGFVYRYMEKHGDQFGHYSLDQFQKRFQVNDALYNDFLAYARSEGLDEKQDSRILIRTEIKRLIKARIAKHLFDDEAFYVVWNDQDPFIQKAIETLHSSKPITSN
jgi:carboxyl-terminal processing protease